MRNAGRERPEQRVTLKLKLKAERQLAEKGGEEEGGEQALQGRGCSERDSEAGGRWGDY